MIKIISYEGVNGVAFDCHESDVVGVFGEPVRRSLKSGIAVSGFNGDNDSHKTIHAFRYGDWDIFKHCMRPFRRSL